MSSIKLNSRFAPAAALLAGGILCGALAGCGSGVIQAAPDNSSSSSSGSSASGSSDPGSTGSGSSGSGSSSSGSSGSQGSGSTDGGSSGSGSGSGSSGSSGSGSGSGSSYTGPVFTGKVTAGTQPIANATVQLYAAGTSGNGSAGTPLLTTALTTDAAGTFTVPLSYSCPAASSQVYAISRGGTVGSSASNSAIALMTAIGSCNSISASTQIVINEVTTAAAAWAFAPFMSAAGSIGASSSNAQGIGNAFATAMSLADPGAGTSPGPGFPANGKSPAAKINTLANVLNACASSIASSCSQLFAATTITGSPAPSDTLAAAYYVVHNPGNNVAALFKLSSASSAYQPVLASTPADWTLFITYTGAAMNQPAGIGVDSKGNVWVSSYFGVVSEFSPIGKPVFDNGITGYGLQSSYGLAIDTQDNIWIPNEDSASGVNNRLGTVTVLNSNGKPISGQTGFSQGGLNYPISIAIDSNGTAWVVDFGNAHLTLLSSTGYPLSGLSGYTTPGLAFPVAVAVDANHNGWVANQGVNYITRISADGKQSTDIHCCDSPDGLAIDQLGYIWVSNFYGSSVSQISSANNSVISAGYTGGGLAYPVGIAVDGAGTLWVANFRSKTSAASPSLSEFAGSASNSPGQALSPATGWGPDAGMLQCYGIVVDSSGSIWITNLANTTNSITKFIGIASPVKTPVIGMPQLP